MIDGYIRGTQGILHLNDVEIATIVPNLVPTKTRMRFRAPAVRFGTLTFGAQNLPLSCTLWLGLFGTDFVLHDSLGKRLAVWRHRGYRTRVLVSRRAGNLLAKAIVGLVIYTVVEKDSSFC